MFNLTHLIFCALGTRKMKREQLVIFSIVSFHRLSHIGYIKNTLYHLIHTIKLSPLYCELAR